MKQFTALYVRLDQTTSTNEKVAAMVDYFRVAPPADAAWAIYFLTGKRLKRLLKRAELWEWLRLVTGYEQWLIDETYQSVGDSAETIALLLPEPATDEIQDVSLTEWITERIQPLPSLTEAERAAAVISWWETLPNDSRFTLNKLLTGGFRVGVSQRLVVRALAQYAELDTAVIAHRLMGNWQPDEDLLPRLLNPDATEVEVSTPYPFFLASPLQQSAGMDPEQLLNEPVAALSESLGDCSDWAAEWKWDGIRAQLIRREGQTFIWSRGEELLEGRFPELEQAAEALPDGTVMDGEILAWEDNGPLPFAVLQRRIGRLKPGPKLLKEAPVSFLIYDLLEVDGSDIRETTLDSRRQALEDLFDTLHSTQHDVSRLEISQQVPVSDWSELAELQGESRARAVEGFIVKRRGSSYQAGRKRGDWWKWKVEPFTIDAVLLYAQPGSGRRSNQLTDYTFAVWNGEDLVPVCKAYSGLTNEEITELDSWIRRNTKERFGPVRSVKPEQIFEIAFEGIQESKRHKSGVAFRFPRMARWRKDIGLKDVETLEQVRQLIGSTD